MEKEIEELQRCRCAECETERQRGCNSSRLKELLGSLFTDKPSLEELPGLHCRRPKTSGTSTDEEGECLCGECELATGDGTYFCQSNKVASSRDKVEEQPT
jgi:hypothetical protein